MAWPKNDERRQDYIELLIELHTEMKNVKEELMLIHKKLDFVHDNCPMCRNDFKWLWWSVRGLIAWLGALTWWIIKKLP